MIRLGAAVVPLVPDARIRIHPRRPLLVFLVLLLALSGYLAATGTMLWGIQDPSVELIRTPTEAVFQRSTDAAASRFRVGVSRFTMILFAALSTMAIAMTVFAPLSPRPRRPPKVRQEFVGVVVVLSIRSINYKQGDDNGREE